MKGKIILRYLRDAEAKQQSMKEQEHKCDGSARERRSRNPDKKKEKKKKT
jgi:hypothetical protein